MERRQSADPFDKGRSQHFVSGDRLWNFDGSLYGAFIVNALAFSLIGDVLLVWRSKAALFGGIAAFLVAHISYAVAFAGLPFDPTAFVVGLFIWNVAAVLLIRWLWQYLAGADRYAVLVYVAAITVMVSFAAATRSPVIWAGAGLFAISDISVARDRFVERSVVNKIWGIPMYYLAQLLLAGSVIHCELIVELVPDRHARSHSRFCLSGLVEGTLLPVLFPPYWAELRISIRTGKIATRTHQMPDSS